MRADRRTWRVLAALATLALIVSACGGGADDDSDADDDAGEQEAGDDGGEGDDGGDDEDGADGDAAAGGDLIVGTTDAVNSLDPAKIYDYYSSNILVNAGDTLEGFEAGETDVSPQLAAEMPEISEDGTVYTFTLRDDVTFHDGSQMTSEDVKFSLERALNLNHPEGAAFLIGAIESIETPDDYTVEITIAEPNVTFLSRLAYTVATILPADYYPAPDGELGEDDDPEEYIEEELVATGPYQVTDFREGESITLEANPDYWGDPPANDRVLVQFYGESAQLKAALEAGEVDIAFRDLDPQQRADLDNNDQIRTVEGEGASIRYVVFNTFMEPFDDPEVRQAFAAAVDRQRIIDEVLEGAGEPLYSMIPPGFESSEPLFQTMYEGEDPASFLSDQETPIELELWYTTDHYGDTEPSIAQSIQRALEESGVFDVQLQSSEWAEFTQDAWPGESATYPSFLLGWYPDYFDPDDYIEPFYDSGAFLGFYANDEMDELIAAEQQVDDPAAAERDEIFADIQQLAAEDVPLLPLYEVTPFAFVREGVEGVENTMDPVQIFRYYEISVTE